MHLSRNNEELAPFGDVPIPLGDAPASASVERGELRLSRTMAYAVQATIYLARELPNLPIPCSQLARIGRMPERFLLQILRRLVQQGVLRSTRGVDGGYSLSRSPKEITLRDVVDALDNPLARSAPLLHGLSPITLALLADTLQDASAAARDVLDRLTIADLLHGDLPARPTR
jgi:Rrf2 family protein